MKVPSLQSFDPSQWESIHSAFENAPAWELGQAWKPSAEEKFRLGRVQIGWQDEALFILARLDDDCLFTRMTADNQEAYLLGDVFEIFIKDAARENYLELHIAPNGHRLQLHFPDGKTIFQMKEQGTKLKDLMVSESLFDSTVRAVPTGWEIFVRLPVTSFGSKIDDLKSSGLRASFSRYDYDDKGSAPVLSSTSAHEVLNFHRQEDWRTLTLEA